MLFSSNGVGRIERDRAGGRVGARSAPMRNGRGGARCLALRHKGVARFPRNDDALPDLRLISKKIGVIALSILRRLGFRVCETMMNWCLAS